MNVKQARMMKVFLLMFLLLFPTTEAAAAQTRCEEATACTNAKMRDCTDLVASCLREADEKAAKAAKDAKTEKERQQREKK